MCQLQGINKSDLFLLRQGTEKILDEAQAQKAKLAMIMVPGTDNIELLGEYYTKRITQLEELYYKINSALQDDG